MPPVFEGTKWDETFCRETPQSTNTILLSAPKTFQGRALRRHPNPSGEEPVILEDVFFNLWESRFYRIVVDEAQMLRSGGLKKPVRIWWTVGL